MIFVIPVYIFNGRKQTLVDMIGILSALRMRGLHDKHHLLAKLRICGKRELFIIITCNFYFCFVCLYILFRPHFFVESKYIVYIVGRPTKEPKSAQNNARSNDQIKISVLLVEINLISSLCKLYMHFICFMMIIYIALRL